MSKRTHYRNPFASRNDEIARLKAELKAKSIEPYVVTFANELSEAVGTILACTPFDKWPEIVKIAYRHCAEQNPTGAHFYMKSHESTDK